MKRYTQGQQVSNVQGVEYLWHAHETETGWDEVHAALPALPVIEDVRVVRVRRYIDLYAEPLQKK